MVKIREGEKVKFPSFKKLMRPASKEQLELFDSAAYGILSDMGVFIDDKAAEIMKDLYQKHEVYILSALNSEYKTHVVEKLNGHNVKKGEQYIEMIVVAERHWDLKINHKFDIYIDDNPNLVEPIKKLKRRYLLLYDQPWNQDIICADNIIRVYDW